MLQRFFPRPFTILSFKNWSITLIFALALLLGLSSCSTSRAGITIPANQEFVLGEYEKSSFRVSLKNTSKLQVQVSAVEKNSGLQTQGFGLAGKGETKLYISRREMVVIKNPHDMDVLVKAKLNKGVEGMGYRSLDP